MAKVFTVPPLPEMVNHKSFYGTVPGLPRQAFFCGDLAIGISKLPVKVAGRRKQKENKN